MQSEGLWHCAHKPSLDHILSHLNPAHILHLIYAFLFYYYLLIYQLKEEALGHTMWRNRFGRGFGPVAWQITDYYYYYYYYLFIYLFIRFRLIFFLSWCACFMSCTVFVNFCSYTFLVLYGNMLPYHAGNVEIIVIVITELLKLCASWLLWLIGVY